MHDGIADMPAPAEKAHPRAPPCRCRPARAPDSRRSTLILCARGRQKGKQRVAAGAGIEIALNDPTTPVRPGDRVLLSFAPSGTASSASVYVTGSDGSRFAIREGGRTVGSGVVTKIIK